MRILFTLLLLTLLPGKIWSAPSHHYLEQRGHNVFVEQRFQDWHNRALQHLPALINSQHPRLVHWRSQMAEIDLLDEKSALESVNRLINSDVVYVDDFFHYHRKDYWSDPETTLEEGGDCEDIALLKAASLHYLGWPEERIHLLIGYLIERGKRESHAVLLVETRNNEQYVLRSITDQVVQPDTFGFIPIYAVDSEGIMVVKSKVHGKN